MSKHVVILGAGPAGSSAAEALSREGAQVDMLEMDSKVGGLCSSTEKNGFIFDLGGHRFITKDDLLLAEIEELMGKELLVRPRKSVIRLQNRFFNYPLEFFDAIKKLPLNISFKSFIDFILTKFGTYKNLSDESFENWITKRFGKTMYSIYFGPYSHKLWGIPPTEISSKWAAQRISLSDITEIFLRMLGKKKNMPKTYATNFLHPKKGIGQIFDRMSEEIQNRKGRIHLNSKVEKIVLKNDRVDHVVYIQDGKEKKISADFVISTIPLPELMLSMEPKLKDVYLDVARKMTFRSIKFIHVMLNKEFVSDNTWVYFPEEKYLFFRIQDRKNWSATTVPKGKNAITLEIACNKGDHIWSGNDEEIFERCMKETEELGFAKRSDVIEYFVEKIEHAYPLYTLDYDEKVKIAYRAISNIKNFITIGRQGLFRYNNMDHSLKMGYLTAKHVLHGYPRQRILEIATEDIIFDWQDPGYHDGHVHVIE